MTNPNEDDDAREQTEEERLRRWRLVLGQEAEDAVGGLKGEYAKFDEILEQLYFGDGARNARGGRSSQGGLGGSAPRVARWLGDVRKYFPKSVVQIIQRDAMERLGLNQMLCEPEMLEQLEVDAHLVATLISLSRVIPDKTKETARSVVRKLVDDVMKRLQAKTVAAVRGALDRSARTSRPKSGELDVHRTIRLNLNNWQPKQRKLIVDKLSGFGRKRRSLYDVCLCVDQSGSMGESVVYSSIFAAVLAQLPALSTRLVLFDTSVVDMTDALGDPVDLLFGAQLGGGTDIGRALQYCQSKIERPSRTVFALVSDLDEGADPRVMLSRMNQLTRSGVKTICLLALNDSGAPYFNRRNAAACAALGIPTFACTPDLFPDLIAAALNGNDVDSWASANELERVAATNWENAPRENDELDDPQVKT